MGHLPMRLLKSGIVVGIVSISCLMGVKEGYEPASRQAEDVLAHTYQINSNPNPGAAHAGEDQNFNSDVLPLELLFHLQEAQAHLGNIPGEKAQNLSASLFMLSLEMRKAFDGYLSTDYTNLPPLQKKLHRELHQVVHQLDKLIQVSKRYHTPVPPGRDVTKANL